MMAVPDRCLSGYVQRGEESSTTLDKLSVRCRRRRVAPRADAGTIDHLAGHLAVLHEPETIFEVDRGEARELK